MSSSLPSIMPAPSKRGQRQHRMATRAPHGAPELCELKGRKRRR